MLLFPNSPIVRQASVLQNIANKVALMLVWIRLANRHRHVEKGTKRFPPLSGVEDEQPVCGDDPFDFLDMSFENLYRVMFIFQSVLEDLLPEGIIHSD